MGVCPCYVGASPYAHLCRPFGDAIPFCEYAVWCVEGLFVGLGSVGIGLLVGHLEGIEDGF